jgi:hypothetical protein
MQVMTYIERILRYTTGDFKQEKIVQFKEDYGDEEGTGTFTHSKISWKYTRH